MRSLLPIVTAPAIATGEEPAMPWELAAVSVAPRRSAAEGADAAGVRGIRYDGLPWRGRPTRVFAWVGVPAATLPGMVPVHGGGGTAQSDAAGPPPSPRRGRDRPA